MSTKQSDSLFSTQKQRNQPMNQILQNNLTIRGAWILAIAAWSLAAPAARAQTAEELKQLKNQLEQMQKTIDAQNARINELEKGKAAKPAAMPGVTAETSPSVRTVEKVAAGEKVAEQSPITDRGAMNDQQEAASRPKDFTLYPKFRGFIPIPNTPALIKFNAKPHLDIITDNENPGSKHRFAPALFPLEGDPAFGGDRQFNVSANATQLRVDVRAPEMNGNFRFYYQNDFFGSDTADMRYRVQHIYGQLYGFKAGFTYGVWEDPDVWPDTVDYEGPNAVIFSRRPVAQYTYAWDDNWNTTVGVEKPDIFVDANTGGNTNANQLTRMPDLGFNTRYEKAGFGHLQFSTMLRSLGAQDDLGRDHHVLGWGVNMGAGLALTTRDALQLLGIYGEGVGGMGNDTSFVNSDAAFDATGDLEALPYWSVMAGFTHRWSEAFRSTITYGYVNLDN